MENRTNNKVNTRKKGTAGEQQAASLLENEGYTIIAKNYRSKRGEIDIVATYEESIVFIEVKSWQVYQLEDLAYVIGPEKRRRIIATSMVFLSKHREYSHYTVRYDVVFLDGQKNRAKHLYNVFTESGAVW